MPVLLNPRPRGIAQLFLAVGETGVLRWQCWRRPGGIQEGRLIWRSRGRNGGKLKVNLDPRKCSPLPLPPVFLGSVDSKWLADAYLRSVDSSGLIGALTDSIGLQVVYNQRLNKK
jgi:hypothetical protein